MPRARAGALLLVMGLLPACESGVVVEAETGGEVSSEDGVFTLVLGPGALPEDTAITIERLAEGDWPVGAPGRFERVAPVYRVRPMGLELLGDAYGVFVPAEPEMLRTAEGEDVLAVQYGWGPSDEKVRPAARSRTLHMADGRVAVVGTVFELGVHWIGERAPGADRELTQLSMGLEPGPAEPALGEPFGPSRMWLRSDASHALFERSVFATVAGPAPLDSIAPLAWDRPVETWDATADPERLLHPFALFLSTASQREEHVALYEDLMPWTLEPGAPLDPAADPLPRWVCEASADDATLFVGVDVVTGASDGVAHVAAVHELGAPGCR